MNNPLAIFLDKRHPITTISVGETIQAMLGVELNPFSGADLGYFEVKSRRNDAVCPYITLGGKKGTIDEVLEQVYNKVQNVLFFEYDLHDDKTFTVTSITIVWDLDKTTFMEYYNENAIKVECRSSGEQKVLKITPRKFFDMYGNKIIEY